MYLSDFKTLIANMPTAYQSATSNREPWEPWLGGTDLLDEALHSIFRDFGGTDEVCISRSDLRRLAKEPQLERFVMATILWGYETPAGLRGDNFRDFTEQPTHLRMLTKSLRDAAAQGIMDWNTHFEKITPIKGIGLSTYTKFLNFLSVKVYGNTALILDDQIVQVARQGVFVELNPLRGLKDSTKVGMYPTYLSCIHKISDKLRVPAENTEFFLYNFGGDLKDIAQNIRLLAYELYEQHGRVDASRCAMVDEISDSAQNPIVSAIATSQQSAASL
jgi:hypothetical protein